MHSLTLMSEEEMKKGLLVLVCIMTNENYQNVSLYTQKKIQCSFLSITISVI